MRAHGFEVGGEAAEKLKILAAKGFDVDELLVKLLNKRNEEILKEKVEIAENLPEEQSEHVPARTKKVLEAEYGTICAIPKCKKASEEIHHTTRFSISKQHNPFYMAPLCKEHHLLAHSVDVKVHEKRREVLSNSAHSLF